MATERPTQMLLISPQAKVARVHAISITAAGLRETKIYNIQYVCAYIYYIDSSINIIGPYCGVNRNVIDPTRAHKQYMYI